MGLERQTAAVLTDIEPFHVERYKWASAYVKDMVVLDAACGCGYGSRVLLDAGAKSVLGVDYSAEAIAYADEHWKQDGITFRVHDLNKGWVVRGRQRLKYDVVVSLETIEHLKSKIPTNLNRVSKVLKMGGILLFSHPTHEKNRGNKYHHWFDINPSKVVADVENSGLEIISSTQQKANHNRYTYHLVAARKVV